MKSGFQLIKKACRSSNHAVTTDSLFFVVLKTLVRLPIDCMYETSRTEVLPTPRHFIFNAMKKVQSAHIWMRAEMEVEQNCQRTYHDYSSQDQTYIENEQALVFFPAVKKKKVRTSLLSERDPKHFWNV